MSCQHGSNEIDMFGLPEDDEYLEEIHTGDEPLRGQDSQPTQFGKRSTSHMHKAPDEETENAHSRRLRQEDQTAQRSAAEAENAHSRRLRREDQTAQHSAAEAERIAHSWHLRSKDHTVQCLAAVTKKSSQVPPASSAPPIASRVTRSQGKSPHRSINGIRSHWRFIHLRGSYGKPSTRSLEKSHEGRKHVDPAQQPLSPERWHFDTSSKRDSQRNI